jgi:hypothetical protein
MARKRILKRRRKRWERERPEARLSSAQHPSVCVGKASKVKERNRQVVKRENVGKVR